MEAPDFALIAEFAATTWLPVAVAAAVAAAVCGAARLLPGGWAAALCAIGVAVGYAAGQAVKAGVPSLPPRSLMDWPFFLAPAVAVAIGLLAIAGGWLARIGAAVVVAAAVIASDAAILRHLPANAALEAQAFAALAAGWGVAHLAGVKIGLLGGAAVPGLAGQIGALLMAGTVVAMCAAGGSLTSAKYAVILVGAALGSAAVGWLRRDAAIAAVAVGMVAVIGGERLLAHRLLLDPPLPVPALMLWAASPAALLVGRLPLFGALPALSWAVPLGLMALLCAAAVGWVLLFGQPEPSGYGY